MEPLTGIACLAEASQWAKAETRDPVLSMDGRLRRRNPFCLAINARRPLSYNGDEQMSNGAVDGD